ncbi:MAG: hypothetical protein WCS31_13310 [Verrucomicrobiae bacterium]
MSALSDMTCSIHAADLLIDGAPEALYQHLFLSMVLGYGRPFFENDGVGRIQCDYPAYPDFGDSEMAVRHTRLLDLRNKFVAHSSAEGTRVQIIPPGVANPLGNRPTPTFDFNIGKRTFRDLRYVKWLRVAPDTFKSRLHSDISQLLAESFGGDLGLDAPFELPTGHENFQWT